MVENRMKNQIELDVGKY